MPCQPYSVAVPGCDRSVIGKHVRTIFNEGELQKESVWAKFANTASDGKTYQVDYYNLDVIISVGYRVKTMEILFFYGMVCP